MLDELKKAYLAKFEELVKQYPGQEINRAYHQRRCQTARLGKVKRRVIQSKLQQNRYVKGDVVLCWDDVNEAYQPECKSVTIWKPGVACPMSVPVEYMEAM